MTAPETSGRPSGDDPSGSSGSSSPSRGDLSVSSGSGSPSRSVIIVGASPDRSRFGNKAVRAYLDGGYVVYPVHPAADQIEGLPVSPSLADVPARAELLLLYVRPDLGLTVIDQAPARGVRRVFLNPGAASPELAARVRALGMEAVEACAIVALGRSPAQYPD